MESPIRQMRKELGISQKALSLALGVSPGYLSNVENGLSGIFPKVKGRLRKLHFNVRELDTAQNAFIEQTREELRRRLMEAQKKGQ